MFNYSEISSCQISVSLAAPYKIQQLITTDINLNMMVFGAELFLNRY